MNTLATTWLIRACARLAWTRTSAIRTIAIVGLAASSSIGLCTHASMAHGQLDSPNGGEVLEVGSTFTIEWRVLIPHDLLGWDLFYSTEGPDGPWTEIALGLEPGDDEAGSEHSYEWTVPDDVDDTVWVQVGMINQGQDYYDSSDAPFSIVGLQCIGDTDSSGAVDVTDLLELLAQWGPCSQCSADLNGDDVVDVSDLLEMLAHWGACE